MLQILIYGAVSSAIYAMLAVGFTLIFGVARILNLAHGAFYALGAYAAYVLTSLLNVPLFHRGTASRCCWSRVLRRGDGAVSGAAVARTRSSPC